MDVLSPIVVVEVETLELEGILDEADVPPFELVDEVLVPSAVLEAEDTVGDVEGLVGLVVVCCILLVVVVIGETLAELDVVWKPEPVVVVAIAPSDVVVVLVVDTRAVVEVVAGGEP